MIPKLPLIFVGTGAIGAPLLETLAQDGRFEIRLVITQPDRPAGRKMEMVPSPIKTKALALGLPLFQPENINTPEAVQEIRRQAPTLVLLWAYGKILKRDVLDVPPRGWVNVHASLLPRHRGASPIQSSLLAGDQTTGLSLMKMVEAMDAGPVYQIFEIPIHDGDNAETLLERLARLGADKIPDPLYAIGLGALKAVAQDDAQATFCKKIDKADGEIDWQEPAETIARKIRAYAGWPGTHTFWEGKRLKILSAEASNEAANGTPGTVFKKDNRLFASTGDGALALKDVQLEGKKTQTAEEFGRGHPDFDTCVLGHTD